MSMRFYSTVLGFFTAAEAFFRFISDVVLLLHGWLDFVRFNSMAIITQALPLYHHIDAMGVMVAAVTFLIYVIKFLVSFIMVYGVVEKKPRLLSVFYHCYRIFTVLRFGVLICYLAKTVFHDRSNITAVAIESFFFITNVMVCLVVQATRGQLVKEEDLQRQIQDTTRHLMTSLVTFDRDQSGLPSYDSVIDKNDKQLLTPDV